MMMFRDEERKQKLEGLNGSHSTPQFTSFVDLCDKSDNVLKEDDSKWADYRVNYSCMQTLDPPSKVDHLNIEKMSMAMHLVA
jgi:hypothetical protein